ncbi:unnamed protein product [Lupinus luteus]|uniref:Uncharacterized protein n=1 Tax=Lupinus luteus TaxID=3873 RepID=A0AAV1XIA2_LUPLU
MSMLSSNADREAISGIVTDSKENNRELVETIELQIGASMMVGQVARGGLATGDAT